MFLKYKIKMLIPKTYQHYMKNCSVAGKIVFYLPSDKTMIWI